MPLFGKQISEDEIDFEYPSNGEFRELLAMKEEVKLRAITSKHMGLFGIQLHFTNGVSTPMFID